MEFNNLEKLYSNTYLTKDWNKIYYTIPKIWQSYKKNVILDVDK